MAANSKSDIEVIVTPCPIYEVCDDETFSSPLANGRLGCLLPKNPEERITRPYGVDAVVGEYMSGMRCPSANRLRVLAHDISDIEDWEKLAVRALFAQLSPVECLEFAITTDSSPRELARLMRECNVTRGEIVNWINQYSNAWKVDKMLTIVAGNRFARG